MPQSTLSLQSLQMRRTEAPIALRLARHDVEVKVRYFLTAANTVVLVKQHSVRGVSIDQGMRQTFGSGQYIRFFSFFKFKKSRRMTARNYDALADLELATIQQGYGQLALFDDLPLMTIAAGDLAEETRIALGHRKVHVDFPVTSGNPRPAA